MKTKKKPKYNLNSSIRSAIRRVFSRSPFVREVLMKVRKEEVKYNKDGSKAAKPAVRYQCNVCKKWFKSTEVAVDHIIPVISIEEGFKNWDTFVERLFCNSMNLQVICDICHHTKTQLERKLRKELEANRKF